MKQVKEVVSREVAEEAFKDYCLNMDIDDASGEDEDDKKGFEQHKKLIVKALMDGTLTVNENSELVLTPKRSPKLQDPLTFREPSAADFMAMDRKKDNAPITKTVVLMDSVTKSAPGTCSKLVGSDFKLAQSIMTLFIA